MSGIGQKHGFAKWQPAICPVDVLRFAECVGGSFSAEQSPRSEHIRTADIAGRSGVSKCGECFASQNADGASLHITQGGDGMLIIARRRGEKVVVCGGMTITVLETRSSGTCRLAFEGDPEKYSVMRSELIGTESNEGSSQSSGDGSRVSEDLARTVADD